MHSPGALLKKNALPTQPPSSPPPPAPPTARYFSFFFSFFAVHSSDLSPPQIELHKTIDLWVSSLRGGFINYDLWNGLKTSSAQSRAAESLENPTHQMNGWLFYLFASSLFLTWSWKRTVGLCFRKKISKGMIEIFFPWVLQRLWWRRAPTFWNQPFLAAPPWASQCRE